MKHKTAKPSKATEQGMQFFTPELYLRFNDPDDVVADRADEEWETAIADYRSHLQEIDPKLSTEARTLSQTCLHDAELLADVESPQPNLGRTVGKWPDWSLVAVLSFKLNDEAVSLVYHLWDRLQKRPAATAWPFSTE
jgi:hypothetical protein